MGSIITNWGTPGISSSKSSTNVSNLTNSGFTAKHTGASAWYWRSFLFNDADFIPPENKLTGIRVTVSFYGNTDSGGVRFHKIDAKSGSDWIGSKYAVSTETRTITIDLLPEDTEANAGRHGFLISYYHNSFSTTYCYFNDFNAEIIYEPIVKNSNLYLGGTQIKEAYLGSRKLNGIYLGSKQLL